MFTFAGVLRTYGVNDHMLECIRRLLVNTRGTVPGSTSTFKTTMGVKQGCPLSPLLFGLYFDRVVEYIKSNTQAADASYVAHLAMLAALYADDVILLAPSPKSLQAQLTCLSTFSASEFLRVSIPKTLVLLENCDGTLKIAN